MVSPPNEPFFQQEFLPHAVPPIRVPQPQVQPPPSRIYVGSIHFRAGEQEVRAEFERFGKIKNIQLKTDPNTGHHKGFCFIEYFDEDSAKRALIGASSISFQGRQCVVNRPTASATAASTSSESEQPRRMTAMEVLASRRGLDLPKSNADPSHPSSGGVPAGAPSRAVCISGFVASKNDVDEELEADVKSECEKLGKVLHFQFYVAQAEGKETVNALIEYSLNEEAQLCIQKMNGRFFAHRPLSAGLIRMDVVSKIKGQ